MNFGVNNIIGYYPASVYGQSKAAHQTGKSAFLNALSSAKTANSSSAEDYTEYLKSKYGKVTIQNIGKDQASLERAGKGMSGSDVVIAPNILEEMANSSEKAAYYEQKIDYFFDAIIPRETAFFAAKGLVFEPGGVVVHEDGTVTYISGCSDSPERVAEVNAINKAKMEKKAAQQKVNQERGVEAAEKRRQETEKLHIEKMQMERVAIAARLSASLPLEGAERGLSSQMVESLATDDYRSLHSLASLYN